MSEWFNETLYPDWRQSHQMKKVLFRANTGVQDLVIFENPLFGRVMALDGVIQVTEGDEFVYHEMLTHVPLLAHGEARQVLVIGGGDGGILREVLKHPDVEKAVLVEIDQGVVDMSKEYLPGISKGALDHPKVEIIIADGIKFVAETNRRFDVIIVDSTDPAGPGEVLFTEAFYKDCKRCLTERGILVTQNGVPFLQREELRNTYQRLKPHFADAGFFVAAVPTYVGGFMTLGWASLDTANRTRSLEEIKSRFAKNPFATQYYNPEIHVASFALPQFVRNEMK